jgi:hypothetical protein
MERGSKACTVAAATALLTAAIIGGAGSAHAALADDGIFIACPDQATLATITTPSCQSLIDAVTAAEAWNAVSRSNATIDLLPGKYCPISLPYDPYDITIQGLGFAGLANSADVSSYTGFEADLSEFTWMGGTCGSSEPAAFLTNLANPAEPSEIWGSLTFQNFAINGAGGVSNGIDAANAGLSLRDMLVENLAGTGVHWSDAFNFYNGGVANSAFVNDGVGTSASSGANHGFSVDESTYAGNTTGISGAGNISVGGDTIAHNTTGLNGTFGQVVGSIVGDNTTNCATNSYEDFGDNVYGSGSCTESTGDVPLASSLGQPTTTGPAITPSIAPPTEAAGLTGGGNLCGDPGRRRPGRELRQWAHLVRCRLDPTLGVG